MVTVRSNDVSTAAMTRNPTGARLTATAPGLAANGAGLPALVRPAPSRALTRGLACALLLTAGTAAAAPVAGLELEWRAPPGCPDAEAVRAMTAAMLGDSAGEGVTTRVRAEVAPVERGFALTIETRSASGTDTRRLQDPRCSVLAEAAAVIAATAVDPSLAAGGAPAPGEQLSPETGSGLIPSAPPGPGPGDMSVGTDVNGPAIAAPLAGPELDAPPAAPEPAPREDRRLRLGVRVAGLVDLGSAPGPTGGLGGTVALLGRLWRAELAGLWLAPRTVRPDPTRDIGARIGLLAGSLRGCLAPRLGRLELPTCAGLEVGALRGEGVGAGIGAATSDVLPWVAVQVGPGLIFAPIRRLALTLQVDLVVPLTRLGFAVGGYGEVYRGGVAAGRAALGLEVRFR